MIDLIELATYLHLLRTAQSVRELAEATGDSQRNVRRKLADLRTLGFTIRVEVKKFGCKTYQAVRPAKDAGKLIRALVRGKSQRPQRVTNSARERQLVEPPREAVIWLRVSTRTQAKKGIAAAEVAHA